MHYVRQSPLIVYVTVYAMPTVKLKQLLEDKSEYQVFERVTTIPTSQYVGQRLNCIHE